MLGSPGLWDAMNPAEVVDYVAAVLASGACRVPQDEPTAAGTDAATAAASIPSADDQQTQRQIQQQLRPDAAVLLADLLTLEAQERLKLRLADLSTLLGLSGAAAGVASGSSTAASAHQHNTQVVPDVSAVVLLLPGPVLAGSQQLPVDQALLLEQLSQVSRWVVFLRGMWRGCLSWSAGLCPGLLAFLPDGWVTRRADGLTREPASTHRLSFLHHTLTLCLTTTANVTRRTGVAAATQRRRLCRPAGTALPMPAHAAAASAWAPSPPAAPPAACCPPA